MIKLQQGGTVRDYLKQTKTNQASSTYVSVPKPLTAQQAEENRNRSAHNQYIEKMKLRKQVDDLKLKGQTVAGNAVADMGTNMLTQVTGFRTPTQEELEQGRGSWTGRGNLIANSITRHLSNELTGGTMNWIGNKLASGEARALVNKGVDAVKNIDPNKIPLVKDIHKVNPLAFKPKADNFYRKIGDEAGYNDAIQSGVIRPNAAGASEGNVVSGINMSRPSDVAYYAKGKPDELYPGKFMVESDKAMYGRGDTNPVLGNTIRSRHYGKAPINAQGAKYDLPTNEVNIYQKNWLKGYKPVQTKQPASDGIIRHNLDDVFTLDDAALAEQVYRPTLKEKLNSVSKQLVTAKDKAMSAKFIPTLKTEQVLPTSIEFKTRPSNQNYKVSAVDDKGESWGDIVLQDGNQGWTKPTTIEINEKLRGNKMQDVLYHLASKESQSRGLNGIRSGDHLLNAENTFKAWDRMNTQVLGEGTSFSKATGKRIDHDIVGITGHKNPNVVQDWLNNYSKLKKTSRVKTSINDILGLKGKTKLSQGLEGWGTNSWNKPAANETNNWL